MRPVAHTLTLSHTHTHTQEMHRDGFVEVLEKQLVSNPGSVRLKKNHHATLVKRGPLHDTPPQCVAGKEKMLVSSWRDAYEVHIKYHTKSFQQYQTKSFQYFIHVGH